MSDLPNKDDHWFSSDCRQAFEGVVERIGCSNGKSILVGLKALLFIIYHLEQQGQGDQIRVVDVDVSLEDGPNFIQALSLRH